MELARLESNLQQKEKQLMDELLRRAIAQNPDLAQALVQLKGQQESAKEDSLHERIKVFKEWQQPFIDEHIANRHIKYDDKVNRNKLQAIRRWNKHLTTKELHIKEYEEYYKPYGIEPPMDVKIAVGLVEPPFQPQPASALPSAS